jgi:hypothetical protein
MGPGFTKATSEFEHDLMNGGRSLSFLQQEEGIRRTGLYNL